MILRKNCWEKTNVMNKNNLLIVGATSGIMISCLERLLNDGYNIFATYHDKQNLQNIPDKIKKSKFVQFLKLDLSSDDNSIIKLKVEDRDQLALVSLDSRSRSFDSSTELIIKKANFKIKLVQPQNNSFTTTIRNKLMWGLDKRS